MGKWGEFMAKHGVEHYAADERVELLRIAREALELRVELDRAITTTSMRGQFMELMAFNKHASDNYPTLARASSESRSSSRPGRA